VRIERFNLKCIICGAENFRPMATRADGIAVIACATCGHGIVETFRSDVLAIYSDEYFSAETSPEFGYLNYEFTAEHGLAWAGALASLLLLRGVVLDIGCADGRALAGLDRGYTKLGIEVNAEMAGRAQRNGVQIIANDLLDPRLAERAGTIDLALAIAVFEHIPDLRGAIQAAVRLLKDDGLLVFEVPLIRSPHDVWFRSSLEHLHYPTEQSLRYLFDCVLELPLWGMPVEVRDFGWVYVGVVSNSREMSPSVRERLEHLFTAEPGVLSPQEGRFRCLFSLVHLADSSPESVSLLRFLEAGNLGPHMLERLTAIWMNSEARLKSVSEQLRGTARLETELQRSTTYLQEVEKARDWHASQAAGRDEIIREQNEQISRLQAYVAEVGKANAGQAEPAKRHEVLQASERQRSELQAYVVELEKARDWQAAESAKRDEMLQGYGRQFSELRAYVAEVEKAREGLAAETAKRDQMLQGYERQLSDLRAYVAEVEKARDWHAAESAKRDQMLQGYERQLLELRAYTAEAERARDWHAAESAKWREALQRGE
jgi:SAM-dependent methyltransferase